MANRGLHGLTCAFLILLAGCGGGGVSSAPAPSPTPTPSPTNASLETLTASQTFTNNSATHAARFDLNTSKTVSGSSASAPLTVTYNAADGSYSVSTGGRSQVFAPADVTSSGQGQAALSKTHPAGRDYLTLWAPSYGGNGPRYAAMGMWQRNATSGNIQDTTLDIFTYGIESASTAIPRLGTAAFATNVFGVMTKPGVEPRSFSGSGNFDIDFLTGVFNSVTPVKESELVSGAAVSGGGIQVSLAGTLAANAGTFSGLAAYGGGNSKSQGTVSGRFYGPTANELGASFTTSGMDGSSTTGGILGLISTRPISANLSLANPVVRQLYYTSNYWVELVNSGQATGTGTGNGQLTIETDGSFSFPGASSDMAFGTIGSADRITPSGANFTTYRKSLNGYLVTVDFYKPGSANTELALTYTSFAHFNELLEVTNQANRYNIYTVYGIPTDTGIVYARQGTARYSGVAHGTGIDAAASAVYRIAGTSTFDVNFSALTLNGALTLTGQSGANTQNYGTLNFATTINNGFPVTSELTKSGVSWGAISPRFFGPIAQEIGATFAFIVPAGVPGAGTAVTGAAVAK